MYRKYRDSLFNIRYSYCGKKYRDVPVHLCIVAGLMTTRRILVVSASVSACVRACVRAWKYEWLSDSKVR